ncbi:DinB family protein [Cohnella boryungensis]|uniref:DinB family protein n=1 Tax=Cohnella boryungensis TaxID=768479 RepID=A0ABV8S9J7_9BACL
MKTIVRMMEHLFWANERLFTDLSGREDADTEIVRLLRHIVVAEEVWITRLEGNSSGHLILWGEAELPALREQIQNNERRYRDYIGRLTEEKLDATVRYSSQSGVPFQDTVRDILAHVALHGQYHRGQINRAVTARMGSPAVLDYIVFCRDEKEKG